LTLHRHIPRSIFIPYRQYFITTVVNKRERGFCNQEIIFLLLKCLTITSILKMTGLNAVAILPEHLHLILTVSEHSTSRFMHSFKSFSSQIINSKQIGKSPFRWQKSFTDHLIRNEDELSKLIYYILTNPQHHNTEGFSWVSPPFSGSAQNKLYDELTDVVNKMLGSNQEIKNVPANINEQLTAKIDTIIAQIYNLEKYG